MKSQLTFTPEVLTCCTLDNHCDYYYFTLLVTYEHLNILAMFCHCPVEIHMIVPLSANQMGQCIGAESCGSHAG